LRGYLWKAVVPCHLEEQINLVQCTMNLLNSQEVGQHVSRVNHGCNLLLLVSQYPNDICQCNIHAT